MTSKSLVQCNPPSSIIVASISSSSEDIESASLSSSTSSSPGTSSLSMHPLSVGIGYIFGGFVFEDIHQEIDRLFGFAIWWGYLLERVADVVAGL